MPISPTSEKRDSAYGIENLNGFYFSTKYPGDDCQTLTMENIASCHEAVETCKQAVDAIIGKYEKAGM